MTLKTKLTERVSEIRVADLGHRMEEWEEQYQKERRVLSHDI